jgi:hypothetical protein
MIDDTCCYTGIWFAETVAPDLPCAFMQFGVRATLSLVVDDAVWGVADLVACGVV